MKKIENILESCKDCGYCQRFNPQRGGIGSAFVCELTQRLITVAPSPYQFEFPNWCPHETYNEAAPESAAPQPVDSDTIILPGMPHLEWMTENLKGHGRGDRRTLQKINNYET